MKIKSRFAIISWLIATSSLSSYATNKVTNIPVHNSASLNIHPQHHSIIELKSSYPKVSKKHQRLPTPSKNYKSEIFTPFKAKEILITFNDQAVDLSTIGINNNNIMITEEKLLELNAAISKYYISQDYLLPHIEFDKKAMESKVLKLNVTVANITHVSIIGQDQDNKLLREYADQITAQQPARKSYTQRMLGLMNKIPGFEVAYELIPHKNQVDAELIVLTSKKKASVFAGVDNFSPNDLGKYQFLLLGEVYTPFTKGDSLILHGSTTNHPERLNDISIGYSYILNTYGTSANILLAHAEDNSTTTQSVTAPNGKSNSIKAAITQQLLLNPNHDLEIEFATHHHTNKQYQVNNNIAQKSYH